MIRNKIVVNKSKNSLIKPKSVLKLLLLFIFLISSTSPFAQVSKTGSTTPTKKTIKGKVTDAATGETIIGCNIWLKETSQGVVTDIDGNYTITFEGNSNVLSASYMGYKTAEVVIDKAVINIALSSTDKSLDEVVVVGYGNQRKASVIGSISTVDVNSLKIPTAKISTALAGQLAGVVSIQRSGEPGAGSDFWIRGISTFGGGSKPLVLVDGIERSIDYVDPEDIETFSILKDATATAVYGVRGANGVVIVTTRKGIEGKPRISAKAEYGTVAPTQMPKMVNSSQFAKSYNEVYGYLNPGKVQYTDAEIAKYENGSDPDLYPNVNWFEELYSDFSTNQRASINISGGGAVARYYVSGSFYNEGSIFKTDNMRKYNSSINYNKFNFRSNLNMTISPTTELNINLSNIYETKTAPGQSTNDIWGYTFSSSPNAFPVRYSNGFLSTPDGSGSNPYNFLTQSGYRIDKYNTAQALVGISQDLKFITPGLRAAIKFSWDANNTYNVTRYADSQRWWATGRNEAGELIFKEMNKGSESLGFETGNGGSSTFYIEGSVNYEKVFKHDQRVSALFLFNQRSLNKFNVDAIESLPFRNQGIAARVTYSFKDTYFGELNAGYNGSENFSPGKRFGLFPAAALGWLVSNEPFFAPATRVVNLLKLKASYGIVGNDQIGGGRRFIYNGIIVESTGYEYGQSHSGMGGLRVGDLANDNVSWEKAYKKNLGIEFGLFKALNVQFDLFSERREGIFLQRLSLPAYLGISSTPYVNVGKMENKGVDATADYTKKFGKLLVTVRGTFSYNRNRLIDQDMPDYNYLYRNRVGKPYGQQYGLVSDGLFESDDQIKNSPTQTFGTPRVGDIKYIDINGDGKVDESDEIAIGRTSTPEINYGFGFSIRYKNFDIAPFFQGTDNVTFFMSGGAVRPFSNPFLDRNSYYEEIYNNSWTLANQNVNATYPRMSIGTNNNNYRNSTYWQRDGGFIRLKYMEVGYSMPKKIYQKLGLGPVRIYLSGTNLLTFSKFNMWDPEISGGQGQGYPPTRVISAGLNLNI
ncbi:MAG TPA: TonB-dependent receptor [Paludibacter sp.]|nr:TonB-dependent receptor [Paludibacter sp.]